MVKRVCCSWILWIFHERGEILGWSTQGKKIIMSKEFIFPIDSCESLIISFFLFFLMMIMMMNVLSRVLIETDSMYVCFRVTID